MVYSSYLEFERGFKLSKVEGHTPVREVQF